ncbi:hypothetical protein ASPWEDRAFT_657459 [Aspergillus wentii DTO 134E9]|uniref:Uncharacterized protein n=1 Tax=Aspergillus wentii DTO 134E9 TaxID=1073089 RepID=A0A1L9RBL1_ASPWE|nr:uncharacterized protein ASPWEDRAFT_657459 [Aspergillus wentii DTO 134E9]OJJ32311.1 hypothetical protein ASPWEDRAFT_657459 [Aspergillus wentii DTO 134E9]
MWRCRLADGVTKYSLAIQLINGSGKLHNSPFWRSDVVESSLWGFAHVVSFFLLWIWGWNAESAFRFFHGTRHLLGI